jgi:hypothetical protein
MAELSMREVLTELHGQDGPRTYKMGSTPIDGVFMTQDLYIVQGGCMPFGKGIGSGHQYLLIYIRVWVLMGHYLEQPRKFSAQRLKCDDPRVRKKYLTHYKQYIKKMRLRESSRALARDSQDLGLTKEQAQEYEQLDALQKREYINYINCAGNHVQVVMLISRYPDGIELPTKSGWRTAVRIQT